ncbi:hypothetical protein D9758_008986 [Tetrapyrgos nigripes]|uniref:Serine aminopeptidase S33 domain-containing protein n=1 Tax=Tetrapyrgos nigripes TaxID=182062 RepID=A0A8H5GKS0_9AGAR|nr:hypothetical protein D9758_008986 [Tetrapyrgos nigripes]
MASSLPTIFSPSTCTRKGLCPVTSIRRQQSAIESHSLYFEQHGTGPERIIFIMGLNASSFAWSRQVQYFASQPNYSVLVVDNRGVGNSGTPRGPYSTSGMAEDVIVLLDYVGWKEPRSIHVVALSLGGMIAQELATKIPGRIISLLLGITTAGGLPWTNFPPWKGVKLLAKSTFTKSIDDKIPIVHEMVFPTSWLEEEYQEGSITGVEQVEDRKRTNREVETELYHAEILLTRPQTLSGSLSQLYAALTHRVSPARLEQISKSIPKIIILTGDVDHLVNPKNSFYLKDKMKEAELIQWKNTGHGLHFQKTREFNAVVERMVEEGREAVSRDRTVDSRTVGESTALESI